MSESDTEPVVTVYSDYVCPFCYLGKASLDRYLESADDPPDVEWHVFDLRGHKRGPDGEIRETVDDGKDDAYYEQARKNVERLREQYGVEMDLEGTRDVDSWNAQKAALFVGGTYDDETFRAFHESVFDAHWLEGRDIGDPDVLADLAAAAGIDGDAVREAVADEALDDELESRFREAAETGVSAVPTFVYDGYAARGAVPPEQLGRLVEGG